MKKTLYILSAIIGFFVVMAIWIATKVVGLVLEFFADAYQYWVEIIIDLKHMK